MKINYKIHPHFSVNGLRLSEKEWLQQAQSWQLHTELYYQNLGFFLEEWLSDAPTIVAHTSGTTGPPKPLLLTKKAMMTSAQATHQYFNLNEKDTVLHCLPITFIAGKMMVVRALVHGYQMIFVPPLASPQWHANTPIHFAAMTPMQVANSVEKLHKIKQLIVGGGAMSSQLKEQLHHLPTQVFETYGMTETITHIAVKSIKDHYFKALPGIYFSTNANGCLNIKVPYISDEIIQTNDVVQLQNDQEFIWLGRADDVINSGGVKLFPEKIATKIQGFLQHDFFITGQKDAYYGEKVVLVIEESAHYDWETIFKSLPRLEKPKAVYLCTAFERTTSGKVQKKQSFSKASIYWTSTK